MKSALKLSLVVVTMTSLAACHKGSDSPAPVPTPYNPALQSQQCADPNVMNNPNNPYYSSCHNGQNPGGINQQFPPGMQNVNNNNPMSIDIVDQGGVGVIKNR